MLFSRTLRIAVLAFLIGILVGGIGLTAILPVDTDNVDHDNPPYTISTGTGCIEQADDWAFTAPVNPNEDADRTFLLRASIAHDTDRELDTRFEHVGNDRYLVVLTTTQAEKTGTPQCQDRVYGSTVDLAATVPGDFETVTIVLDNTQIATVENSRDRAPTYQSLSF